MFSLCGSFSGAQVLTINTFVQFLVISFYIADNFSVFLTETAVHIIGRRQAN